MMENNRVLRPNNKVKSPSQSSCLSSLKNQSKIDQSAPQQLSDYELFLWKSKRDGGNHSTSIFDSIVIESKTKGPVEDNIRDVNFPILSYSKEQLVEISCQIISEEKCPISKKPVLLKQLITQVSKGYNIVSYHNFSHGFSLMHLLFNCIKMEPCFEKLISVEEKQFIYLSALAHDIHHPGTNNGFETKMNSDIFKEAGGEGNLEKMHIRSFLAILKSKEFNFISSTDHPKLMQEMIVRLILATDVSQHFKNLEKLKLLKQAKQLDFSSNDHRYFVLEQLFHACDIGNPCLKYEQYINWAALLTYQFNNQVHLEEINKLEITEMLRYKGKKAFYKGQIGFINGLVLPLWNQLSHTWQGLSGLTENIKSNLMKLESESEKEFVD